MNKLIIAIAIVVLGVGFLCVRDAEVEDIGTYNSMKRLKHNTVFTGTTTMTSLVVDSTTITSHGTPHDLADGEYTGDTVIGLAHENLIFGDVCYMNTDTTGEYVKSQNDASGKPGLVMALATISANNWGVFLQVGYVCRTSWTTVQTKGAWVYVDDDTAGLATTTRPPDTGDFWNVIGYCTGTDIMFFNPDYTVVEVP